ncbi:MAG: hypothetical protein QOD32_2953 [Pyrinomonadaceae bacterium]|jgi:hypothetical protein|nr:hypothetical protein [Pyrinomonadaceae bacterium]
MPTHSVGASASQARQAHIAGQLLLTFKTGGHIFHQPRTLSRLHICADEIYFVRLPLITLTKEHLHA